MKSVIYHPGIKQSPELYGLAEKANRRLNEIAGEFGKDAEAEWDATEDEKSRKRLVKLTIRDLPEEVRGTFPREDLQDASMLTFRLAGLWGDLLGVRSLRLIHGLMDDKGDQESN